MPVPETTCGYTTRRCLHLVLVSLLSVFLVLNSVALAGNSPTVSERVTVYYFHSTIRCETCLFVEGLAEATLRAEFTEELENGTLVWRSLDRQLPANDHLVTEFGLTSNGLVVVQESVGGKRRWESFPDLWEQAPDPERLSLHLLEMVARSLGKKN